MVAWLSIIASTSLVIGKTYVGFKIGSVAILSEAIHSTIDLLAAMIALYAVTKSQIPADDDHPFGHGKFENLSGMIEAVLIFIAAFWILYEALHKLLDGTPMPELELGLGIGIMLASSMVNLVVAKLLFRIAKKSDSIALEADGMHLLTDVYTSLGVVVGLLLILLGERLWPSLNWHWLDPMAAIVVALMILKAAYDLTKKSLRDLLDTGLPEEETSWLHQYTSKLHYRFPEIHSIHRIRTRKSGAERFIDFHLVVAPEVTVANSHHLTDVLCEEIKQKFPSANIMIHVEPCDMECSEHCLSGCFEKLKMTERKESREKKREIKE
ncbi:MAG: cation transporter [Oligoflexia bacterium]|nr:cation transporter [Oligoflexia bacterium]